MPFMLKCTVCKGTFKKKEWLDHLLSSPHNKLARLNFIKLNQSGNCNKLRRKIIVAFAKESVAKEGRILKHFSKNVLGGVMDFIWWPARPGVGFLQFDNWKIVKKKMKSVQNNQVIIQGQTFQLKMGQEIIDFEWDQLLPLMEVSVQNETEEQLQPTEDTDVVLISEIQPSRPQAAEVITIVDHSSSEGNTSSQEVASPKRKKRKVDYPQPYHQTEVFNINLDKSALNTILNCIKSEVEISEDEYNAMVQLADQLNSIISSKIPSSTTFLIGNWILKLKYYYFGKFGSPTYYVLASKPGNDGGVNATTLCVSNRTLCNLLESRSPLPFKIQCKEKELLLLGHVQFKNRIFVKYSVFMLNPAEYTHVPHFLLTSYRFVSVEAQMWTLAKYLCSFDPCCQSLMQIVYYWANVNSFHPSVTGQNKISVDPIGLTWSVIFFLSTKNVIPVPKTILEVPHQPVYFTVNGNKFDIGFSKEFSKKSKEKVKREKLSPHDIMSLALTFFKFWKGFGKGNWIILGREGIYCDLDKLKRTSISNGSGSSTDVYIIGKEDIKIDAEQLENIITKSKSELLKKRSKNPDEQDADNYEEFVYFASPFHLSWDIPIFRETFIKMGRMADKLQSFLESEPAKTNNNGGKLWDSNSVKDLFKLT